MYHPFAKQRLITAIASAVFFLLIFPYKLLFLGDALPVHKVFCVILAGLSTALLGLMLYKALIKFLSVDDYSKYGWWMAIQAFCHLVFAKMNPGSVVCIGVTAAAGVVMLIHGLHYRALHANDPIYHEQEEC